MVVYDRDETYRMYADYQTGMTLQEVAEKYYYAGATSVSARFRCEGLPTRQPHTIKILESDMPHIIDLRAQGLTYDEIGAELGTSSTSILHAYKRYGIPKTKIPRKCTIRAEEKIRQAHEMYEDYKAGMLLEQIKAKYRCSDTLIFMRFKEAGLPTIPRQQRLKTRFIRFAFTDDEIREVYADYVAGATIYELTQKYNCRQDMLYKRFRRLHLKLKPRGERSRCIIKREDVPHILELRAQGMTLAAIGDLYGVGTETVARTLKRYGAEYGDLRRKKREGDADGNSR